MTHEGFRPVGDSGRPAVVRSFADRRVAAALALLGLPL
jgi:hypothetical protein